MDLSMVKEPDLMSENGEVHKLFTAQGFHGIKVSELFPIIAIDEFQPTIGLTHARGENIKSRPLCRKELGR